MILSTSDKLLLPVSLKLKPVWLRNARNVCLTYGTRNYYPDFIVYKGDECFVIETKGEIYSDHRKNKLLQHLENVNTEEIPHCLPVLAMSDFISKIQGNNDTWDNFVAEAREYTQRRSIEYAYEYYVSEEKKYIEYIPIYTVENAYKKFIKKNDVRPNGWKYYKNDNKIPIKRTIFCIQNNGAELLGISDPWLLFDADFSIDELNNKAVFAFGKDFDDYYREKYTVRYCRAARSHQGNELFEKIKLILSFPLRPDISEISLVYNEDDFTIIGKHALPIDMH